MTAMDYDSTRQAGAPALPGTCSERTGNAPARIDAAPCNAPRPVYEGRVSTRTRHHRSTYEGGRG